MKIKICGLKYKENIEQVVALRPDYIGFIFYSGSKRYVGENFIMPDVASQIAKVGVFVNADQEYTINKIKEYKLDYVQLHGDESVEYCKKISNYSKIIKAFGVDNFFSFKTIEEYKNVCDYFLFDTKTSEYGGSGKQFDWNIFKEYDNEVPFFLSGGIGIEEIKKVRSIQNKFPVFAIDVNSKFEIKQGLKDIEKLKEIKLCIR